MGNYALGQEVMGDDNSSVKTSHALLIKVKNAPDLARSQGALAAFAQMLAPATVENKVYEEMATKLKASLKDQNVLADVSIVDPAAWKPSVGAHLWSDVAWALGGAGVLAIVLRVFGGGHK